MNNSKQTFLLRITICLILIPFLSGSALGYIYYNGSGDVYSGSEQNPLTNTTIKSKIEKGAGFFLEAHSNILRFSRLYELSNQNGIDYAEWSSVLNNALSNLRSARRIYNRLVRTAEATSYIWEVQYQLWYFDYRGFCAINNLNPVIFAQMADYLWVGDVTGIYRRVAVKIGQIETLVSELKSDTDARLFPDLCKVWRLNELISTELIAGQYVAMVFHSL